MHLQYIDAIFIICSVYTNRNLDFPNRHICESMSLKFVKLTEILCEYKLIVESKALYTINGTTTIVIAIMEFSYH